MSCGLPVISPASNSVSGGVTSPSGLSSGEGVTGSSPSISTAFGGKSARERTCCSSTSSGTITCCPTRSLMNLLSASRSTRRLSVVVISGWPVMPGK